MSRDIDELKKMTAGGKVLPRNFFAVSIGRKVPPTVSLMAECVTEQVVSEVIS